jgi:hypothetical protein
MRKQSNRRANMVDDAVAACVKPLRQTTAVPPAAGIEQLARQLGISTRIAYRRRAGDDGRPTTPSR